MADIELVIKIPEEIGVAINRMGLLRIPDEMQKKVDRAIQKGIQLPEHHGRIIDESKIITVYAHTEEEKNVTGMKLTRTTITHTDAPTIIEGSDSE